jgi:leucyl-tRNA synthetase
MVIKDGAKMSKSKGNVVDPDQLLEQYGADTARHFSLFASPPEKDLDCSDQGVEGSYRFLNRVWRLVENHLPVIAGLDGKWPAIGDLRAGRELFRELHRTIKRVTDDIEDDFHFNTAISAMMELVNEVSRLELDGDDEEKTDKRRILKAALETILLLLAPFAPHISEELWRRMGHPESIFENPWPRHDEQALAEESSLVVVQIDGRVRHRIHVPASSGEEEVKAAALSSKRIRGLLGDRAVRRVVYVPQKLVNIVLQ